jgi:hypothetical protein
VGGRARARRNDDQRRAQAADVGLEPPFSHQRGAARVLAVAAAKGGPGD